MSEMTPIESIERFVEGLKKAASAARELAALQKYPIWLQVATNLEMIRVQGMEIVQSKPLTETELNEEFEKLRLRTLAEAAIRETMH